jgi:dTDP-4-amino-4,6-dideoxygalactose transaminase
MRSLTTFGGSGDEQTIGRWVPRSDIPVQPVLSWNTFSSRNPATVPAVVDSGRTVYLPSARIAIAHALELAGVQPGHKVLVPAFHCISMIEPLSHVGAKPVFYALRQDLSVDLDDIAAKLDGDTRVLIAVNYFGFPQDLATLRQFCDGRGLIFLEDCAHSFFGANAGRPLGSFGHFAVASLAKFFPVQEGGCLVVGSGTPTHGRAMRPRSQGLGANAAAALNTLEDAVSVGRLLALEPALNLVRGAKGMMRRVLPRPTAPPSQNPAQQRSGQVGGFDPAWMGVGATAVSRAIARFASRRQIAENRRQNYARLARDFGGLRHCRPLLPRLPDGVVPYMFPLWIDKLADVFASLEDRAVAMQRFGQFLWPTMDEATCEVSSRLSRHLIQLPCHQALTEDDIAVLVDRVRSVAA